VYACYNGGRRLVQADCIRPCSNAKEDPVTPQSCHVQNTSCAFLPLLLQGCLCPSFTTSHVPIMYSNQLIGHHILLAGCHQVCTGSTPLRLRSGDTACLLTVTPFGSTRELPVLAHLRGLCHDARTPQNAPSPFYAPYIANTSIFSVEKEENIPKIIDMATSSQQQVIRSQKTSQTLV
jgi:hypothetical protein